MKICQNIKEDCLKNFLTKIGNDKHWTTFYESYKFDRTPTESGRLFYVALFYHAVWTHSYGEVVNFVTYTRRIFIPISDDTETIKINEAA